MNDIIELKTVDSMPGSINALISTSKRLCRPPSLSESFAWEPQNIERLSRSQLLSPSTSTNDLTQSLIPSEPLHTVTLPTNKTGLEPKLVGICVKLLLHITLISVFETLFFFFYVSTLENSGIERTMSGFIDGVVQSCQNLTQFEVELVDTLLGPYLNVSSTIAEGNQEENVRSQFNDTIMLQSWMYVVGLSALFIMVAIYSRIRKLTILWRPIILENTAMVLLLALYEYMFFDTIIYRYRPITAKEIARNVFQEFQGECGLFLNTTAAAV